MDAPEPGNPAADFIANLQNELMEPLPHTAGVAFIPKGLPGSLNLDMSDLSSSKQSQDFAIAKDTAAAPSADLEQPAAPESDELATSAGKRPLAHFGQALPATKSKANRKLVLQLTPEMYQYFAHVATLPALNGVALPDLALAILQAWREDYRPDIKRANAAFKA